MADTNRHYTRHEVFLRQRVEELYHKKSSYWERMRADEALALVRLSAERVPAYKDFLKKAKIKSETLRTFEDFQKIPSVNKNNYLRKYPLEALCTDGSFSRLPLVLTSTSGSTGAPFYFPRSDGLDTQSAFYHQMFLQNARVDPHKSTLVVVCFGMGVWIGGIITYEAFKTISREGTPLTIITPGVNKREIFEALKTMAPKYDQVVLCGYPPFMKDLIDEAEDHGIDWKKFDLRMVFAAEAFSEAFRDYIIAKTGMRDAYRDTMNIYGSADLGTMAEETPLTIMVRRLALANESLYKKIFKEAHRLPTLAQYYPDFITFDCVDGRIYCTGDNVLPLVRYEIGDNGGVMSFDELETIFASEGLDLRAEARKAGIEDTVAELPLVYIYERTDLSTKLYGAIIYPEYVKSALIVPDLQEHITGKFTMYTKHDEKQDEYLEINVELKAGSEGTRSLEKAVSQAVVASLSANSAEHHNNMTMVPEKVKPRIVFWPHEHPTHFQTGAKQKWVKK